MPDYTDGWRRSIRSVMTCPPERSAPRVGKPAAFEQKLLRQTAALARADPRDRKTPRIG